MKWLYLVAGWDNKSPDEFLKMVGEAIEGGVNIVQLRQKDASARELIAYGEALKALLESYGIPLLINDRVDVAHALGADGVHLGQSDLPLSHARAILGPKALIGLSIETLDHIKKADAADYLAASPVLTTRTKPDCGTPWGWDGLKRACDLSLRPVIAIGGMNETNAAFACQCGAAGVAVVSAITEAACPKTAARKIRDAIS